MGKRKAIRLNGVLPCAGHSRSIKRFEEEWLEWQFGGRVDEWERDELEVPVRLARSGNSARIMKSEAVVLGQTVRQRPKVSLAKQLGLRLKGSTDNQYVVIDHVIFVQQADMVRPNIGYVQGRIVGKKRIYTAR